MEAANEKLFFNWKKIFNKILYEKFENVHVFEYFYYYKLFWVVGELHSIRGDSIWFEFDNWMEK